MAAGAYLVQRRDSHTQLLLGMTEHVDGVAKVFVEFPEMRPYFHAGEEAKGTTDLQRAEAIAVYLSNAMDFVFVHLGKIDDAGKAAWERYFAYVFQNSPVLRGFLEEHKGWYGGQFQEHVKGLEADFEQSVRVKQRLALQSPVLLRVRRSVRTSPVTSSIGGPRRRRSDRSGTDRPLCRGRARARRSARGRRSV